MIQKKAEALLPTKFGEFRVIAFKADNNGHEYAALVKGNIREKNNVLVRVHSSCLTGDVFASLKCDCREQLIQSMKMIQKNGGVLVYDKEQEGRGLGFSNKILSYNLQENGFDTVEASHSLGFSEDMRTYNASAEILKELGVRSVCLLTNNPDKIRQLEAFGIKMGKRMPLQTKPNRFNKKYLETKKKKLGHLL